jgi:hypothetical protein
MPAVSLVYEMATLTNKCLYGIFKLLQVTDVVVTTH